MTVVSRILSRWLCVLVAVSGIPTFAAGTAPPPKTAVTTDLSDLWWSPSEPGWGMQVVQEDNVAFATLFIYDADQRPTWASAQLTYAGGGLYLGPLYVTTGPYFDGPFDPSNVAVRKAGTMTFTALSIETGQLEYTIDGVAIRKTVRRQTLKADNFSGTYLLTFNMTVSGCSDPSRNGYGTGSTVATVTQTADTMAMVWQVSASASCTHTGRFYQAGKFGRLVGSYGCSGGEEGTADFFEMTNRVGMLSGRLVFRSPSDGCTIVGRFVGLNPRVP
jgi:hypothetical protein